MKKIMKLFPAALALLAMTSCSDDNIFSEKVAQEPANALHFSVENTATRAGIVGNVMTTSPQFRWVTGDAILVYQDDLAAWDKYTYAGAEFGTEDTFTPDAQNELSSFSIGLYPADEVVGVYMDTQDKQYKHIQMELPVEYTYQEGLNKDAVGSAGYRCDMPMYGRISGTGQAVTEMNFLTAWTRIYLRDVPADMKYVVLVSDNPDQPLTGRFVADVPEASLIAAGTYVDAEGNTKNADNSPILIADETFKTTWGNMVYAENPYATATSPEVADSFAICFPVLANNLITHNGAEQTYDKLTVYACKNDPTAVADWAAEVAADDAIEIASRQWTPSARKKVWVVRYTEPLVVNVDEFNPLLPGDLTDIIAAKKNTAINELVLKLQASTATKPVLYSSEGYERNHVTTIPVMGNGANVTIDMNDASMQLYTAENWTINGDFEGTLTIKQGESKSAAIAGLTAPKATAKIEINLPHADVVIVSDGTNDLSNIDIQQCETVTIGDGETVTKMPATKSLVVRDGSAIIATKASVEKVIAQPNYTNNTIADEVIVMDGGNIGNATINTQTDVTLLGGGYDETIDTQYEGGLAQIGTLDCSGLVITDEANPFIDIYSQGYSRIAVLTPMADLSKLQIKSKALPKTALDNTCEKAIVCDYNGDYAIVTASQLAKLTDGFAATYKIVADEIDLNNVEWTGGAASGNVYGINYNVADAKMYNQATPAEKLLTTKTGQTIIKNLDLTVDDATNEPNGLFATADGTDKKLAGFTLSAVSFIDPELAVSADIPMGALVGSNTKALTIDDVKVIGIDVDVAGLSYAGGLIGKAAADLNISDVSVSGTISARGFVGGIVGGTENSSLKFTKTTTQVGFGTVVNLISGTSLNDAVAGTFGCFVGGATANATIDIYDCNYGTAINKQTKGDGINNAGLRFGAKANTLDIPFFGGNAWLGRYTNAAGVLTSYVSTAADQMSYKKFVYAAEQMTMTTWTGGTAAFTGGTQSTATGATILYDGSGATTANPNEGFQYGTQIFGTYTDNPKLGYNASYKDNKTE